MKIRNALETIQDEGFKTIGESLTKQEFKKTSCINNVVKQYQLNGVDLMSKQPKVDQTVINDLTSLPNYAESLQQLINAQYAFDSLDPEIRDRFSNDPQKLINFLGDAKNRPEAERLGLVNIAQPEPNMQQPKPSEITK